MDFKEYQEKSKETAAYPAIGEGYVYPVLGLVNEAGEVAGKVKKIFRDDGGKLGLERLEMLSKELGDVLWYLSQTCTELGLELDEVAKLNVERLADRKARGVISGDGDNR